MRGLLMSKNTIFIVLFVFVSILTVQSQSNTINLSVTPGVEIPFGPLSSEGEEMYTFGGSVNLAGEMPFSSESPFFGTGLLDYSLISTTAETSISLLSVAAGAGISYDPVSKLNLKLAAAAGWGMGIYEGSVGSNPLAQVRGSVSFNFSPSFSLGLNASYKYLYNIYNGMGAGLTVSFVPGSGSGKSKIIIPEIQFDPVFPVFYSYYDENPLGAAVIQNLENGAIKNVRISLQVKQFMDSPKICASIPAIAKNEEIRVPLLALFSERILSITEGTKVPADIIVQYDYMGTELTKTETATIQMYDRNAMTWDDDRKAASFVTAKDPVILRFAKSIAGETRNSGSNAINTNFRIGMGLFQALSLYGINYVVDPKTPYEDFSKNKFSLDYLQFPSQTLTYKAGDCDDLSILYTAFLKSVGIEAAFITIPGHIYAAFSLEMDPEEAKRTFLNEDDLIFTENNTWIPIEITMINEGFLKAWKKGATEWRSAEGKRGFFPIDDAWKVYKPVGSPGGDVVDAQPPDSTRLADSYNTELNTFIKREINEQVATIKNQISRSNNKKRLINRLGVLYARYGLYDEAAIEFKKISGSYVPGMTNLGNIYFQKPDFMAALSWYGKALDKDPDNKTALLGSARANYEIENMGSVRMIYAKLEKVDSRLADRYAYLVSGSDDTGRASSAVFRESAVWEEE